MGKNKNNAKFKKVQGNIPYKKCLNCGAELNGMYCHVCGQYATSKTPSISGFIMEYIYNAFIWDPKFLSTLSKLVRRPGHLTNEYLSGKFISQEHPLKFNMFLLLVFVTLFALFSSVEKMSSSIQKFTKDEMMLPGIQMGLLKNDKAYSIKIKESPRDTIQLQAPLMLATEYPVIIGKIRVIEDTKGKSLDKWTAVLPHVFIEDGIVVLVYL